MQVFTSEELQLHPADVQQSALLEPTFITVEGRPRLVMMSLNEFDRLRRARHKVIDAVELPEDVLSEMRRITREYPVDESELRLMGGLLDDPAGVETQEPR